jgi:type I restriction enzyme S subunit
LVLLGEDGAKWGAGDRSAFAISGKSWVNNHAHVLRPNRDVLLDEWLTHYLVSADLMEYISGVTVPKLNQARMRDIPIPLPPLDEQKRIVARLDELEDEASTLLEVKSLTESIEGDLWDAVMDQAFSSMVDKAETSTIGQVFKTSSGGTPLKSRKDFYSGGEIPWLLSGEVGQRRIVAASRFVTDLALTETSIKWVPEKSVLVAMYGATAGEVGVLTFPSTTNQAVCSIHPAEGQDPDFVYYFMLRTKSELVGLASGNAQPNISQQKIKGLEYPLIAVRQQREIVERLDACREVLDRRTALRHAERTSVGRMRQLAMSALLGGLT